MLKQLSWASYWEAVIIILVIYYVFIGIRFYAMDVRQLWNRFLTQTGLFPKPADPLLYDAGMADTDPATLSTAFPDNQYPEDMHEADQLIASLKDCISAASGKAYYPDALKTQIKALFQTHHSVKSSPHRPAIVEMVVSECEVTGTAVLTEEEVDQWWSS